MIPRIWLINVVLALFVLFVGTSAYRVWTREEPLEAMEPSAELPVPAPEKLQTSERRSLRESAYSVIVERTLFTPDRAEFLSETSEVVIEDKPPFVAGRRLNLYGVIVLDDDRKALIDNPNREPDQPPRRWVRVGEILGDWTVGAIEPESIVLKEGANKYRIPLFTEESGRSSKAPGTPSTSSPTVVNTEAQRPSSSPKVISSGTGTRTKRETSRAGARKNDEGTGETETIVTPFGTITKKKGSE